MLSERDAPSAGGHDPRALAESLGPALKKQSVDKAAAFLRYFLEEGLSARAAAREARVGEALSSGWLKTLGLKRDRSEVQALQRKILDAARQRSVEDRANARDLRRAAAAA